MKQELILGLKQSIRSGSYYVISRKTSSKNLETKANIELFNSGLVCLYLWFIPFFFFQDVKRDMALLEKQKTELQHSVDILRGEEERLRQDSESETQRISEDFETRAQQLQQQISGLESNKRELGEDVEKLERDEATLRCNIEELQHESQLLSQRISQMKESVLESGRRRVSWVEDKVGHKILTR